MVLTPEERAQRDALNAKEAAPDEDESPAETAEEVAADVGAATVETVGEVAEVVAAVVTEAVNDARSEEAERLAAERDRAVLEAAAAQMNRVAAEAELERERVETPDDDVPEDTAPPAPISDVHADAEAGGVVVVNSDDDDDIHDSTPGSGATHPWFRPRTEWSARRAQRKQR